MQSGMSLAFVHEQSQVLSLVLRVGELFGLRSVASYPHCLGIVEIEKGGNLSLQC